jgi:hypothetical protein
VFYTLDVSQYAIGANEKDNFYHCINKALQKREPKLLHQLSGQVTRVQSHPYSSPKNHQLLSGTLQRQQLPGNILCYCRKTVSV